MKYRREIDGLRAIAVISVIFFHAGFPSFKGGFIGVDVFFVISGYLITSIILEDLQNDRFSIVKFYERRARRILPALFTVMAVSSVFAYRWMLPDELKNYGQSVIATTMFGNNILLAITSGYWTLTSEFKPLLHTWTLGVEEQFYIFFPFLLMFCWAFLKKKSVLLFGVLALMSFAMAAWGAYRFPDESFYLLPTRAWELLAGVASAYYVRRDKERRGSSRRIEALGLVGLLLITAGIFFTSSNPFQSHLFTILPVAGSVLIVLFAYERTVAGKILGHKVLVGIGLISYSLYLWHQPILVFARIYSKDAPRASVRLGLVVLTFLFSYFSWRFIEQPFRDRGKISQRVIFSGGLAVSMVFIAYGLYLVESYGVLSRIYNPRVAPITAMDKRVYNERVFRYKADRFTDAGDLRILVTGNSFGRDFINMSLETFDTRNIQFVYRDDLGQCILPFKRPFENELYKEAQVIVIASWDPSESRCVHENLDYARENGKELFYIGSKQFGYNLDWILRLRPSELPNQYNSMLPDTMELESRMAAAVPPYNYISLLAPVVKGDEIPITDEKGFLLSADRGHLTKFGAIYFGNKALLPSRYGDLISKDVSSLSSHIASNVGFGSNNTGSVHASALPQGHRQLKQISRRQAQQRAERCDLQSDRRPIRFARAYDSYCDKVN